MHTNNATYTMYQFTLAVYLVYYVKKFIPSTPRRYTEPLIAKKATKLANNDERKQ